MQFLPPVINDNIELWSEFELIDESVILKILERTRTKSGINNVNVTVIKILMKCCPEVIVQHMNKCLQEAVCPDIWKYTIVTPIPKVKNTIKASEMRPINQAYALDKLLQAVVKTQLEEHLEKNQILTRYQSGFRDKHSCETSLNLVLNEMKEQKALGKSIIAVFLDLKKAFETVD